MKLIRLFGNVTDQTGVRETIIALGFLSRKIISGRSSKIILGWVLHWTLLCLSGLDNLFTLLFFIIFIFSVFIYLFIYLLLFTHLRGFFLHQH